MRILIEDFGGMMPIRESRLLPPNMSAFTANADLETGALQPVTLPLLIHSFGVATRRAIRIPDPADVDNPIWMGFTSRNARIFPGPLVNDSFRRHVWLDNNAPGEPQRLVQNSLQRIKDEDDPYLLGVPAPDIAPTVVPDASGVGSTISRSYVFTLVNVFGEEGQPSTPTASISGKNDDVWAVSGLALPAGIDAAERGITHYRIYRTVSGATGTAFFRVADVAIAGSTYNDTRTDLAVATDGLLLESVLWREPEEMEGFIELPNGFFAGWNGRSVFFSEPYRPWAWPAEYILSTSYDIIAAGVSGSALILFTTSKPVIIAGNRPENMQIIESESAEPCFFPNSAVTAAEGVYYVGRTGLFLATQASLTNLTRDIIRQTDWQEDYQLTNLSVARINDTQVLVLSTEGFGFVLDLSNSRTGLIRIENLSTIDSVWNDPYTGEVHAISDNDVYRWQAPDAPSAIALWESKEFHLPKPVNFGAFKVSVPADAESYVEDELPDSIITVPVPPVPGGPWLEEAAIWNYALFNGVLFNEAPADGTDPPDADAEAIGFPYWYGIVAADNNPDVVLDLPAGEFARLEVYANDVLVYNHFIERTTFRSIRHQRLPSGHKADRWRFVFTTRVPILRFAVAETGRELMET